MMFERLWLLDFNSVCAYPCLFCCTLFFNRQIYDLTVPVLHAFKPCDLLICVAVMISYSDWIWTSGFIRWSRFVQPEPNCFLKLLLFYCLNPCVCFCTPASFLKLNLLQFSNLLFVFLYFLASYLITSNIVHFFLSLFRNSILIRVFLVNVSIFVPCIFYSLRNDLFFYLMHFYFNFLSINVVSYILRL